jgi:hypothetical protein
MFTIPIPSLASLLAFRLKPTHTSHSVIG